MRKTTICLILLCLTTLAMAQREVHICLDLKGLQNSDSLTLSWGATNKPLTPLILSVGALEQGTLRIPLNEPRLIIIGLKGCSGGYELLASPNENIQVSGRIKKSKANKRQIVEFSRVEVNGASWHLPYQSAIAEYLYHIDSLETAITENFEDVQKIIKKAKEEKNEQMIADMYQSNQGQGYIQNVTNKYSDINAHFKKVVLKQKNNFLAPLLMLRFGGQLEKKDQALYDALSDEAKQSYYGREVKEAVYPPSMLGNTAPTVAVMTRDGQEKLLSFNHHNNRYLLLDFWASWCEPCLREVPNLKALYEKYHSRGLDLIGLSVDRNVQNWKETLDEMDEPWCNYIDIDKQAILEYQVQYIPSIFIMDANGKIISEKLRGKDLSDFIEKLFEE